MKAEIRTLGFDDSPHTRPDGRVPVVGVHMRGSVRVEGLVLTDVERDGTRRVRCADRALRALAAAAVAQDSPCGGARACP
ncbi:MAG TPA: DUF99 family protein [Candidatus Thermoplasmatota archaeon]|nr:DUF99 family protein [Candidatus Thermoplasmatota archaeon]